MIRLVKVVLCKRIGNIPQEVRFLYCSIYSFYRVSLIKGSSDLPLVGVSLKEEEASLCPRRGLSNSLEKLVSALAEGVPKSSSSTLPPLRGGTLSPKEEARSSPSPRVYYTTLKKLNSAPSQRGYYSSPTKHKKLISAPLRGVSYQSQEADLCPSPRGYTLP